MDEVYNINLIIYYYQDPFIGSFNKIMIIPEDKLI